MCCDLLSNCIFSAFYHISFEFRFRYETVVICFQIVSLVRSITSAEFIKYLQEGL